MENGAISAIGTHAELEVTSGIYQEFLRHQAATAA
jgi:ABC-type transport system involved in cytochrome bd biosynthesis fused ATPase/permease subunit